MDDAEMEIRMTFDERGKLGMEDVSSAAESVEYTVEIKSPAAPEKIQEMMRLIDRGCHTLNTIRQPVPVYPRVVHNGVELVLEG